MAEEQKITVPETTPVVEPVVEAPKTEETPATETPAVEAPKEEAAKETTEAPAAEASEAPKEEEKKDEEAKEEPKKEEAKPIEAGSLEHKGAPASFPKNMMYSKNHFWFGTDAVEKEKLAAYQKAEKVAATAQHVISWASETGKGLFFYAKESDKSTPVGVIQLADASEPTVEGNKFTLTSKGHKHTFKAANVADRDNWVAQLKAKIAEAKELAATVPETETYKKTLESFKPAPPAKKEEPKKEEAKEEAKPEEAAATEAPAAEETPATEETPAAAEEKKEEPKEEKKEEKKARSSSKKRTSIFGSLLSKKEEPKKEETKEETPAETSEAAATETPAVEETPAAAEETPAATEEAKEETKAEEAKEEPKKEEAKPALNKRSSIFSSLSFGKKKPEAEAAPAAKEEDKKDESEPVAETAPVIPAVETTEPLSTEVKEPAADKPAESTEAAAATNGETKKDMKSEKRKSSLPFAFGKKDKAESSADEAEKPKSPPFFSKLRQTVKGKGKAVEKPAATEETKEETPAETAEASEPVKAEETKEEEKKDEETKADPAPVATEPAGENAVPAAAAPVTAAA